MKVVITTIGKFHNFDMARQLQKHNAFEAIFTGYPEYMLRNEGLPMDKIRSFPYFQTPFMWLARFRPPPWFMKQLSWTASESLDRHVAKQLPPCDAYIALSKSGLRAARVAKSRGAVYICDRGSSHIRAANELLKEEHRRYGIQYGGIDPRVIEKEEKEYALADAILVPSTFAMRTYLEHGVPESKLAYTPYGADLSKFYPTGVPDEKFFDIVFVGEVSVQKGIRYLVEAFKMLDVPRKRLTIVGAVNPLARQYLDAQIPGLAVELTGSLPSNQVRDRMSRAHVLVLPSVQDGFGLVMAQAMSCGCPVIGSTHTGALDLVTEGVDGYVVPVRDPYVLTDRLLALANDPALRKTMSLAALEKVKSLGGWDHYGMVLMSHLTRLTGLPAE